MGTLYHYIGTREDILNLIIGYGLSRYQGFFEKIIAARRTMKPADSLKYAIDLLYRTMDSNQDFALGFYREIKNASVELRDRMVEIENNYISSFELILKDGCENGDFHVKNAKLVANNIVVNGEMWAVRRGYLKKHYTIDSYIKEQTDLTLKTIT
jgi:AcrR family transcriptional regulator